MSIDLSPIEEPVCLPRVEGFRNVSTSIGCKGEAIRLWIPESIAQKWQGPGRNSFTRSHREELYPARVLITSLTGSRDCELMLSGAPYPSTQVLPGGDILVVAPRCWCFQDGTAEMNAKIYGPGGFLKSEFCLGDGIQHVQVDTHGRIWVGYFDEGVFGNCGWGFTGDVAPLGAAGLVCYTDQGEKLWEYKAPSGFQYIADCYVLNATSDAVWACYYTDFPIVRIGFGWDIRAWETDLSGPTALAVSGEYVLAYGGYRENATNSILLLLLQGLAVELDDVNLRLPSDVRLDQSTVIGRDKILHVFHRDDWFRFTPKE